MANERSWGKVIKGGYFMSPPSKLAMLRFPGLPG
jgi:hypothetical protein